MPESTTTRQPPQFTTRFLFLLTGVIAGCLVPMIHWGWMGLPLSLFIAIFIGLILKKKYVSAAGFFTGVSMLLLLLLILKTHLNQESQRIRQMVQSNRDLRFIEVAIRNYSDEHGHLPPPYTTDENGDPLHSWRVLILPYLEEEELYRKFDLTTPWDDPKNLALANEMPLVYLGPNAITLEVTTTYVALLGDHTAWPRTGNRKFADIVDGTSKTLLLVESEKHRMHWMSTDDPGIESLGPASSDGETLLTHRSRKDGFLCVSCDGAVRWLEPDYPFNDFLSLLTIDGGEEHKLP